MKKKSIIAILAIYIIGMMIYTGYRLHMNSLLSYPLPALGIDVHTPMQMTGLDLWFAFLSTVPFIAILLAMISVVFKNRSKAEQ